MKQLLFSICLSFLCLTAFGQKYTADTKASSVNWTGHAQTGVYSPKGTLKIKSAMLTVAKGKLTGGTVVVDMGTLQQDNSELEGHLRGKDFFDVEKYPEATLTLSSVNGTSAYGKLTVRGITQPITCTFTTSEQSGRMIINASASIDRTLYGIKYNSTSYFQDLGSYAIRNIFEIEVNLVTNQNKNLRSLL